MERLHRVTVHLTSQQVITLHRMMEENLELLAKAEAELVDSISIKIRDALRQVIDEANLDEKG